LRLLVVGGSLGAKALNDIVPKALALLPLEQRPLVLHQSGARRSMPCGPGTHRPGSRQSSPRSSTTPPRRLPTADLIVCRAGASTVTEIAAVGAAALFVPFPFAVDDHQTTNAAFLVDRAAAG
jgi:UDP-N-acetylglucosamine--N-acetylmuramyl-(pentapeptide) pyrophosphoryl-undecaprenol N-acetylglucosamine transferase